MKISELIALLEQRKEELGDLEVLTYEGGAYEPVKYVELIHQDNKGVGLEIY